MTEIHGPDGYTSAACLHARDPEQTPERREALHRKCQQGYGWGRELCRCACHQTVDGDPE